MNNPPPIPYERMNVNELIREAERSENKLAMRLENGRKNEAMEHDIVFADKMYQRGIL